MKHLHFFGKYMGDIKSVYHVLRDSGQYKITTNLRYSGIPQEMPSDPDFLVTSHNPPRYAQAKNIHIQHGYGVGGRLLHETDEEYVNSYVATYYALGLYGEDQKSQHVARGFPEDKVMLLGMPTSIEVLAPVNPPDRETWLRSKGLDPRRKTIMYLPSWDNGTYRELFQLWFDDRNEARRVEAFCSWITQTLACNLIVRLHEKHRYSKDWLGLYRPIFDHFGVHYTYLEDNPDIIPYLRYCDQGIGDVSNANTYFLVMDKPITFIGSGVLDKWAGKKGGWPLSDRAGHKIMTFVDLLEAVRIDLEDPGMFADARQEAVNKNIAHIGDDCRQAIISEFDRITNL